MLGSIKICSTKMLGSIKIDCQGRYSYTINMSNTKMNITINGLKKDLIYSL